jgi:ArsR family transcriptional regulator
MESKQAVTSLGALAQETRLAIYRLLVQAGSEGVSVSEIGAEVEASGATLSFHLKELTHAGLIQARQEGRYIFYSADYNQMQGLLSFLTENCCAQNGPGGDVDSKVCRPKRASRSVKTKVVSISRVAQRRRATAMLTGRR